MTKVRKFFTLPPSKQRDVASAAIIVALVRAALWMFPLGLLLRWLEKLEGPDQHPDARDASPEVIVWAVRAVSPYVPRATCLTQALAARLLLARRGVRATLRLGVVRSEETIEGHAWLEYGDRVLIGESSLARYAPLEPVDEHAA